MADNILRTYGDGSAVKDVVLNTIEILTAKETQIFNMLGKTKAINTIHIFQTDTLATAASQAVAEGADYTALTRTTPSDLTNIVEMVAIPYKVTRTQRDIKHYHGQDELNRQTNKALKEWGNAAEFDLVKHCVAIWQHIVRKFFLITWEPLTYKMRAIRGKQIYIVQPQRLSERTPYMGEAIV